MGARRGEARSSAAQILKAVLYRGELPRGDAAGVVGTSERHARRIVSALIERGVLIGDSARAVASCFSGHIGFSLDARIVPRNAKFARIE